jgi:multidrug efflux pump subunit AcrA (membrane-fusion protein)
VGGMLVNASLRIASREALSVPSRAVIADGETHHVFVVENGKATKRAIRIGAADDDMIEIVDGLAATDRIVVSGLHRVSDGANVDSETSAHEEVAE